MSVLARARFAFSRALRRAVHFPPLRWAFLLYRLLNRARALGLAAEMAFWFFLALIPLAAVAGMIAVKVTLATHGTLAPLLVPVPGSVRAFLSNELAKVSAWEGGTVAPIGSAVFVWLASSGLHAIFETLEIQTHARPRPWWQKRSLAIACCICLSAGVGAIATIGIAFEWLWQRVQPTIPLGEGAATAEWIVRVVLAAAISFGLIVGLYKVGIPQVKSRPLPVVPGALLAVALELVLGHGYRFYLSTLGDGSAYMGSLATIGVTLMTLYLMATAILTGSELNQLLAVTRSVARQRERGANEPK